MSFDLHNNNYASAGRSRGYSLTAMLWALIIQKVFSIPTDSLLLTFLESQKIKGSSAAFPGCPMPQGSHAL